MSAADVKPCGGHYFLWGKCQNCGAPDPDPPAPKADPRDTEIERLRVELAEVRAQLEQAMAQGSLAIRARDRYRAERDESRAECISLRGALTVAEQRLALRSDCHAGPGTTEPACGACTACLLRDLDSMHRIIERLNHDVATLTRERDEARRDLDSLRGDIEERLPAYAADAETEDEIASPGEIVEHAGAEIRRLTAALAESRQEVERLTADRDRWIETAAASERGCLAAEAEARALRERVERMTGAIRKLESEYRALGRSEYEAWTVADDLRTTLGDPPVAPPNKDPKAP